MPKHSVKLFYTLIFHYYGVWCLAVLKIGCQVLTSTSRLSTSSEVALPVNLIFFYPVTFSQLFFLTDDVLLFFVDFYAVYLVVMSTTMETLSKVTPPLTIHHVCFPCFVYPSNQVQSAYLFDDRY